MNGMGNGPASPPPRPPVWRISRTWTISYTEYHSMVSHWTIRLCFQPARPDQRGLGEDSSPAWFLSKLNLGRPTATTVHRAIGGRICSCFSYGSPRDKQDSGARTGNTCRPFSRDNGQDQCSEHQVDPYY